MQEVWKFLLLALVSALVIGAGQATYATSRESAAMSRKLDAIETGRLRSGTRVDFTTAEINAWVRDEARQYFPGAIRNIRIEPGNNAATGYATVDFVRLRQTATGEAPGWIMRNLFSGERSVVVKAHVAAMRGRARVDLDLVQISGVPIEGSALDFLIQNYVRPTFPELRIGEWFRLADRVDHVTLTPSGASAFIVR